MSRVDMLRASSSRAEAQYRQELSSVRSLRHEESRERSRVAESQKEFWRQTAVAAKAHGEAPRANTPMCPTEGMWRTYETLKTTLAKHSEAVERLQVGSKKLASAQERIDLLQKMIGAARRQRACRIENRLAEEIGELATSLSKSQPRLNYQERPNTEPHTLEICSPREALIPRGNSPQPSAVPSVVVPQSELKAIERAPLDCRLVATSVAAEQSGNQRALSVECSLGARGGVSVSLSKRDGEPIKAVVSAGSALLTMSIQRDRALLLSRLQAMGVRVGSLSVGDNSSGSRGETAGQRMRRRGAQGEDEPRIA